VAPYRLPRAARLQIADPLLAFDASATAGVRVRFRSRASTLSLRFGCALLQLEDMRMSGAVDLVVDGEFITRSRIEGGGTMRLENGYGSAIAGDDVVVTFEGLHAEAKDIELWLPHTASCALIEIRSDAPIERASPDDRPTWLHYGSSISHCLESPGPTDTWPARAAAGAGRRGLNLGFAGRAMLDAVVAESIRDVATDYISLKIGINLADTDFREHALAPRLGRFLDIIREGHPVTPLLVVSAISCPRLERQALPGALTLERSREILEDAVDRRAVTDSHIAYMDGRTLLGPADVGDLPDGMHPSPEGYRRMADRFVESAPLGFSI
jgi:lysophospholipase L1-like esterase